MWEVLSNNKKYHSYLNVPKWKQGHWKETAKQIKTLKINNKTKTCESAVNAYIDVYIVFYKEYFLCILKFVQEIIWLWMFLEIFFIV